jgi:hypothetical protein
MTPLDIFNVKNIDDVRTMIAFLVTASKIVNLKEIDVAKAVLHNTADFYAGKRKTVPLATLWWIERKNILPEEDIIRLRANMQASTTMSPVVDYRSIISMRKMEEIVAKYAKWCNYADLIDSIPLEIVELYGHGPRLQYLASPDSLPKIGIKSKYDDKDTGLKISQFIRQVQRINPHLLSRMPKVVESTHGLAIRIVNLAIIIPPKKVTIDEDHPSHNKN